MDLDKNLLIDTWLEVSKDTNERSMISVSDIGRSDIVGIRSPRADFKGALYQFLVGLLQTTFAPEDREEWLKYWKSPPEKRTLQAAYSSYIKAFKLVSTVGEPAFMQDLNLDEGKDSSVFSLLIEAPGDNTLKNNQDIFIKRGGVERISPYWASIALFTLQINAPSGGQGHRVSLRGGGPLTTLLLPPNVQQFKTLWHTLWLNVLTKEEMRDVPGNEQLTEQHHIFPWMGDTRTSEKDGSETYPQHANPLQVFWSMPRRIRLRINEGEGECGISGDSNAILVNRIETLTYGINYAGNWQHPLTPYVFETGKVPFSIKAQASGLGYRHWLELAMKHEKGKQVRSSARIVKVYRDIRYHWLKREYREQSNFTFEPSLWVFGFDMDNMKARCWYEASMPIFNLGDDRLDEIQDVAKRMVEAASDVLGTLKSSLKKAWFRDPKNNPNAKKFNENTAGIDREFWSRTESEFFRILGLQVAALQNAKEDEKSLKGWKKYLRETVTELFELYAMSDGNEDGDYLLVIKARHSKGGLEHYLNGSKALKNLVT